MGFDGQLVLLYSKSIIILTTADCVGETGVLVGQVPVTVVDAVDIAVVGVAMSEKGIVFTAIFIEGLNSYDSARKKTMTAIEDINALFTFHAGHCIWVLAKAMICKTATCMSGIRSGKSVGIMMRLL